MRSELWPLLPLLLALVPPPEAVPELREAPAGVDGASGSARERVRAGCAVVVGVAGVARESVRGGVGAVGGALGGGPMSWERS
jgi:hypothetical protein